MCMSRALSYNYWFSYSCCVTVVEIDQSTAVFCSCAISMYGIIYARVTRPCSMKELSIKLMVR